MGSALTERTCGWFVDLPRRLDVAIEVLDARGASLLPPGPTFAGRLMRKLLTDDEAFRSMVDGAHQSGTLQFAAFQSVQVACVPVESSGTVIVAREIKADDDSDKTRSELAQIGGWLAAVIRDTVAKPTELSVEPYRIASLERILREALVRGSFRTVLGAFVEAFAVWEHVHVAAYVATTTGRFVRFVSPIGASANPGPPVLEGPFGGGEIVRLQPEEAERLHPGQPGADVLVQQLTSGDHVRCVLLFRGEISPILEVRIRLYAAILREMMDEAVGKDVTQIDAAIARQPMPASGEPLEPAMEALTGTLLRLVGADLGAVAIRVNRGQRTLTFGRTELLPPSNATSTGHLLTVTRCDDANSILLVACRDQAEFTTVDQSTAEYATAAVHRWLRAALEHANRFERRERARRTDVVFEKLASDAVRLGQHVSVVVLSLGTSFLRPGLMQSYVARVRDQIRASDYAAALSDSEIVVLLIEAEKQQADTTAARLAACLESESDGVPLRPHVSLAAIAPSDDAPQSIIQAARANLPEVA